MPPRSPLVTKLMEEGIYWEHSDAGNVFAMDEGSALLRYYVELLAAKNPEANDALAETHRTVVSATLARYEPMLVAPLACDKGCSWCCHQHVSVTAPEVFAIVRYARSLANGSAIAANVARRWANLHIVAGRDFDIRNPCGFLSAAGACAIHVARPVICRIYVSGDVRACRVALSAGTGEIPSTVLHYAIRNWCTPALWSALHIAGLPVRDYGLMGAVNAVFADPSIEARWYAGEDLLAPFSSEEETAGPAMMAEIAQWREIAGL